MLNTKVKLLFFKLVQTPGTFSTLFFEMAIKWNNHQYK